MWLTDALLGIIATMLGYKFVTGDKLTSRILERLDKLERIEDAHSGALTVLITRVAPELSTTFDFRRDRTPSP